MALFTPILTKNEYQLGCWKYAVAFHCAGCGDVGGRSRVVASAGEWCFAVIFSILAAAFDECKMCPLLTNSECVQCDIDCVWDNACNFKTSTGGVSYTKWNGFFEIGQTHVVRSESFTFPKSEYDT
eukprot:CAMPEP_0172520874 /NCGR_PEP_ID=MMETSP1066-20121228/292251_1 /TAXON_ID=671091 /ORGANISM="Coscinodiscus wailesii, Strain CCMP2513" /LENGTH=125 /DNA_ID=CAMNT_0013303691 /DNA_START=925 /DNA_END=1302 /DNA_ORIENTATION=-